MRLFLLIIVLPLFAPAAYGQSIPANATPAASGTTWSCNRGYVRVKETCEKVAVPENGELSYSGSFWICKRGYRQSGAKCDPVTVPLNASLDYTGHDWRCDRGYYQRGSSCLPVRVPEHGVLGYTGNDWRCERGFVRADSLCREVEVPVNGLLSASGSDWVCARGYKRTGSKCDVVVVPPNATLSRLGDGWTCDAGYKQVNAQCLRMSDAERTADSVRAQRIAERIAAIRAERGLGASCTVEYRSNTEVCVTPGRSDLDCSESLSGGSYNSCEVVVRYDIRTNYDGRQSLSADVQCRAYIEYSRSGSSFSGSDYSRKTATHLLFAKGSESGRLRLSFQFGMFDKVERVRVTTVRCEPTSVLVY